MPPHPCLHLVARAIPNTLLFHSWTEALALWRRLVVAFPDAMAICVMPNHLHLVTRDPRARRKLSGVMSGFARWRAVRRGLLDATCWERQPEAEIIPDHLHLQRTIRYVLLNPCRARLASDPLRWPMSNHRDLVGLSPDFSPVPRPEDLHRYVSGDPTVTTTGTELPGTFFEDVSFDRIADVVGSVLRREPHELSTDRFVTRCAVRTALSNSGQSHRRIAEWAGCSQSFVYLAERAAEVPSVALDTALACVRRALGDDRFVALKLPARANPVYAASWTQG